MVPMEQMQYHIFQYFRICNSFRNSASTQLLAPLQFGSTEVLFSKETVLPPTSLSNSAGQVIKKGMHCDIYNLVMPIEIDMHKPFGICRVIRIFSIYSSVFSINYFRAVRIMWLVKEKRWIYHKSPAEIFIYRISQPHIHIIRISFGRKQNTDCISR